MKKLILVLVYLANALTSNAIDGALPGVFSVSPTKKVRFSQGNLQYNKSTDTWRFAERQEDFIGSPSSVKQGDPPFGTVEGSDNAKIADDDYEGWIDLFGWGTSGWEGSAGRDHPDVYMPYRWVEDNSYYCLDFEDAFYNGNNYCSADWGIYNKISNGGNAAGIWHTLTADEWNYLSRERHDASKKIYYMREPMGVVLLPDEWPESLLKEAIFDLRQFTNGTTTRKVKYIKYINNWQEWEKAGAVLLPFAGIRSGSRVGRKDTSRNCFHGHYWTATTSSRMIGDVSDRAKHFCLCAIEKGEEEKYINDDEHDKCVGNSVRLVVDTQTWPLNITQPENGTISILETDINPDAVELGSTLHFVAEPAEGFEFDAWSGCNDDGSLTVSYHTFSDTNITCSFKPKQATSIGKAKVESTAPPKVVENGTIYIIKNGEKYTLQGVKVKE